MIGKKTFGMNLSHIGFVIIIAVLSLFVACSGSDSTVVDPDVVIQDSIDQANTDNDSIDWYLDSKGIDLATVTTEESGIRYFLLQEGNGELPDLNDIVSVDYTGKFLNDIVFDTTIEDVATTADIVVSGRVYTPLKFNYTTNLLSGFIPGFNEGLSRVMSMTNSSGDRVFSKGSKALLMIPSAIAYGTRGTVDQFGFATGVVDPNTVLLFEFTLVNFRP